MGQWEERWPMWTARDWAGLGEGGDAAGTTALMPRRFGAPTEKFQSGSPESMSYG